MFHKQNLRVLIFDTKDLPFHVNEVLGASGFNILLAGNSKQIIEKSLTHKPHLIFLDVNMPDADGIDTCTELRSHHELDHAPIIFYTSKDDDYTKIAAFNAGADDYIIRPAKAAIIICRIKALVKRSNFQNEYDEDFQNSESGFIIDRERYLVMNNGTKIILPRKEFELLWLLNSSPKKVFTRTEISKKIWGSDVSSENRTIEVHIRRLREKLGKNYVSTVKGVGYRINI